MNFYEHFKNSKGNRDPIFKEVLSYFKERPISILEIGSLRDNSVYSRMSDGWSSFHFLEYIHAYGGELHICDISNSSLAVCRDTLASCPFMSPLLDARSLEFFQGDGKNFINPKYDLIYLDGGDDPNQMREQYILTNPLNQYVLCDDFHQKGTILKQMVEHYRTYKWVGYDAEMGLFGPDVLKEIREIHPIQ